MNKNKIKDTNCDICKKEFPREALDLHHKDCNHTNNDLDNFQTVCACCHRTLHYQLIPRLVCCVCEKEVKNLMSFGNYGETIEDVYKVCFKCWHKIDLYYYRGEYAKDLNMDVFKFMDSKHDDRRKCLEYYKKNKQ